eukprot:scaffold2329_cov182-Prasinococcus_capsulatus_cf.AAC.1
MRPGGGWLAPPSPPLPASSAARRTRGGEDGIPSYVSACCAARSGQASSRMRGCPSVLSPPRRAGLSRQEWNRSLARSPARWP